MTKTKVVFYAAILSLLLSGLWYARHRRDRRVDSSIASKALPAQARAEYLIDSSHHKIVSVVRQPNGTITTKTQYIPPHIKLVEGKDGVITVQERKWGTELATQFGFAYSDKARICLGEGVFYVNKWELVPFVAVGVSKLDLRLGVAVSYTVYSNTRLFVGVQTNGTPTGGISFNF